MRRGLQLSTRCSRSEIWNRDLCSRRQINRQELIVRRGSIFDDGAEKSDSRDESIRGVKQSRFEVADREEWQFVT